MPYRPGSTIDRREAIRRVASIFGGATLVGSTAFWTACQKERGAAYQGVGTFTSEDVALLDEIADTILPPTETPGAKAAMVGPFIALMVTDCFDTEDQKVFMDGLRQFDQATPATGNVRFGAATPEARLTWIEGLDREAKTYMDAAAKDAPRHYFRMIKELTLLGYFTSEIGYTQAMRYVESPGRFDPCAPYAAGETIWASHA
ncbi:MAG: hypothetical protein MNPFHGCM_02963 [Gemmatimonadaceae bacterium]|nr:hypothetical protein [Gemmatimonadaceae bacterium]